MTNLTFRSRPDVSRRRRAWILAGVGAAGVGVAGLSAGTAGADPVTDQAVVPGPTGVADPLAAAAATAGQIADTVGDMARAAGIPVPGPITPDAPGGQAAQAVLPTTLLRRDESAETAPQTTPAPVVAAGGPAGGADDGTSAPQFAPGAVTTARAAAGDADAAAQVGRGVTKAITDPSVIGDVISAIDAPTPYDIDQTIKQTSQAITDVVTGKALADAQAAIDRTLSGPEFADWATNTANAFAARTGNGWERAADGVAAAIDHITRDPAGFIGQAVVEGGGVARLATDPAGFARQVVEKIAGPDILADIDVVIGDYVVPSLIDAVRAAAPALLIPAAAFLPGFVAGTGLAAPWTSGLGAAAGALNPLAHLVGLATSLLGAPLGALATGLPGFLASALMTLPIALMAPLLGAAAGSALALAGWASLVYGAWAATLIPVGVAAIGLGGLAGVLAGGALMAISGLNPIMVPAAIAGGVLTFLFVATMIVGGYTLATVLIPTIIYLLGVIPVLLAGAGVGFLAGLIPGLAAPLLGIPAITGLSAIPGAILGGIGGYLLGDLATRAVSAAIGAGLGGLAAPLVGGIPGGLLTSALSLPATILAALALAGMSLNNSRLNMSGRVRDAIDDITRALTEGWNRSKTKRVLDALMGNWFTTDTGRDIAAAQNAWWRIGQMLGGRIHAFVDPNAVIRDAATGGGIGAVLGGLLGGLIGGLAGLFNPANLLGAIPGFLGGAGLGAPIGGLLGLIPPLLAGPLAGLASLPLTFLPNLLAVLAAEGALMLPAILAAAAVALVPPAVLATGAWIIGSLAVSAPLWIPLTIAATACTLVAFALSNLAIGVIFPPALALLPFALPIGTVGTVLALVNLAVIAGALGLGLVTIWPATFLLTAPLFVFPALGVPAALLASVPLALPIAAGMSIAEAIVIGSVVAGLTGLLTVPAGVVAGGLLGGLTGAGLGVLVTALADGVLGATIGAELGSLPGGAAGAVIGAIIGALRSLQVHIDPPVADLHVTAGGGDTPAPAPAPAPAPEPALVEVPAAMLPDYAVHADTPTDAPVAAGARELVGV
ncbi:hypothetical protein [Corynebacterium bovis]|uniref:hypothetical protein n=1 Tax=Corynebacterium bovis TaxID=36808 RepID=UPI000F6361C5|nr:hypothetical protein [Corynebacterium bovis]